MKTMIQTVDLCHSARDEHPMSTDRIELARTYHRTVELVRRTRNLIGTFTRYAPYHT